MKIAVIYKWCRNNQDASVRADGSVDWRNAKNVPGEDDSAALRCAQTLADQASAEIVGLTIGDGDVSWALARGVQSTVSITGVPQFDDAAATAHALAQGVKAIDGVTHVVLGDSSQHPAVAACLGAELGLTTLLGIHELAFDGTEVIAQRHGATHTEKYRVSGPSLFGVAALSEETSKPGMKEMLAARKRPVTVRSAAELGIPTTDGIAVRAASVPVSRAATMFDGDVNSAVEALVSALKNQRVLG
jgi:electron transfer flavoprotein beta subunit